MIQNICSQFIELKHINISVKKKKTLIYMYREREKIIIVK